jgi:hypothetical protein
MGATSQMSWGAGVDVLDLGTVDFAAGATIKPSAVIYSGADLSVITLPLIGGSGNYATACLSTKYSTTFSVAAALGTAANPVELDIVKSGSVTIAGVVANVYAPIKNASGAPIAMTGATLAAGAATVYPDGLTGTSTGTYASTYPQYCPTTAGYSNAYKPSGLIDVLKSMTLDLTGVTGGSYAFPLGLVVESGQTLTIKLPTYNSGAGAGTKGSTTYAINLTGFLSGSGNIVVDSAGTGAGLVTFSGDTSLWSGTIALATASVTANHTSLVLPALRFSASGIYASALSLPANTTQVVDVSAANGSITGAITGLGHMRVLSGSGTQRTLKLAANNTGWAGNLYYGDGTTTTGAKVQVDNANGLGANTDAGSIIVNASLTTAPVLAINNNLTTAKTVSVNGATASLTSNALNIDTYSGFTSNFNGVVSGTPTANGNALGVIGQGTTNLNAANTHSAFDATANTYATYVTNGTIGMGVATSLSNGTYNGALLDDGTQLTVPTGSVTISNAITLLQGSAIITAPSAGATTTFTGVKSGAGGLIRGAGAGAWTESAQHTYAGGFTSSVTGAVINVGATASAGVYSALGNGPVAIGNATLAFSGAYSLNTNPIAVTAALTVDDGGYSVVIPADISGAGVITKKATAGTLTLTPPTANTFTNAIINLGGTVAAGNANSVAGASNNMTLSSATSGFLPNGALTALKNTGATAITLKVQ